MNPLIVYSYDVSAHVDSKVRKTQDPNSEVVKGGLPNGTVVKVLERVVMDDGSERAHIQLQDQHKPLGWVTAVKQDGRQNVAPMRGGMLTPNHPQASPQPLDSPWSRSSASSSSSQMRDVVEMPTSRSSGSGKRKKKKTTVIANALAQPRVLSEEEQAARMKSLIAAATASNNMSSYVKNKFHFFSFQVAAAGSTANLL